MRYRGSLALITGASSGIGAEFARRLADAGSDLVLVARREQILEDLATKLRGAHGVTVHVVAMDLALPGAAHALVEQVDRLGQGVDLLVNNAGFGLMGDLAVADLDRVGRMMQLNMVTLTELTRELLPGMISRGRGGVLNVASVAAYQGVPSLAVYAATKAYVLALTDALAVETRGTGVHVTTLCPGATDTEFAQVAGTDIKGGQSPAAVVDAALRAWSRNVPAVVPGAGNRLMVLGTRLAPRATAARLAGRVMRRR